MSQENKKNAYRQGWQQFLTNKLQMLSAYRLAKHKEIDRTIKTEHGNVAEAEFRKWLETFLPKKFAVTSGYILKNTPEAFGALAHFDIIIYDQINSPVLWVEESESKTHIGKSKAIPVEHVYGVIEVKSTFTTESVKNSIKKLDELKPFLGLDDPNEPCKQYLPANFFSCMVFFEIKKDNEFKHSALSGIVYPERGFYGALILSGEGKDENETALVKIHSLDNPGNIIKKPKEWSLIASGWSISDTKKLRNINLSAMLTWDLSNFAQFAFDLIASLNGAYDPRRSASWHGRAIKRELPSDE